MWLLLAVVAVVFGAVAWHKSVRHHLFPRNFGVVEDGVLYRSGRLTPTATKRVVERHGIRTIVDLGAYDKHPAHERVAQETAVALGVRRVVLRLQGDATGDPNDYVTALRAINDPANQPVLVHCAAGSQRTGACVMFYEHFTDGTGLDQLHGEAARYGHDPDDNTRLRPFVDRWVESIRESLETGVPIEVPEGTPGTGGSGAPDSGGS